MGGFPNIIVSEEVSVVARMLMAGWNLAYRADAEVMHSHALGLTKVFSRYFDIAVHHSRENWTFDEFGHVGGEGALFLISELRFLMNHAPHLIPMATLKNASKWFGYQIGLRERYLPVWSKQMLSAQKTFWIPPTPLSLVETHPTKRGKLHLVPRLTNFPEQRGG